MCLRHRAIQIRAGSDQLGCPLRDPEYRRVRRRRYRRGHHRGVDNPQAVNPVHTQLRVHHRKVVRTDSARADQVEEGIRATPQERAAILVALDLFAGKKFRTAPGRQCGAMRDFACLP